MTRLTVRGARQHNLAGVDLDLPLDALVVLAGRSGSGKSSLAFDTLHAEGQRRYLEALSTRLREVVGALPRPDVDVVHGLPPTVALPQHEPVPTGRSTVGTTSELDTVLKVLFGRAGTQHCPVSGEVVRATPHDAIVEAVLALPADARLHVEAPVRGEGRGLLEDVARAGFSRIRVRDAVRRLEEVRPEEVDGPVRIVVDRLKVRGERRDRLHDALRTATRAGGGVVVIVVEDDAGRRELVFTDRPYSFATGETLPELGPALFRVPGPDACPVCRGRGEVDGAPCEACEGTGLGPVARAVTFAGDTLPSIARRPLARLREDVAAWPRDRVTEPLLAELAARLDALVGLGLGHLQLRTAVQALGSGELQRLRLARQIGADLSGVLFVLDEPTTGLDADRVVELVGVLRGLVARGNGVLVVEHHPAVIAAADRVIEFGPGPGRDGGRVVFDGPPEALRGADTATGHWLAGGLRLEPVGVRPSGWLRARGLVGKNLVGDPFRVPVGGLAVLTGPSGAGKSAALSALDEAFRARLEGRGTDALEGGEGLTRLVLVDALATRRSRRSLPATYVGLWDVLRELLAATQEARVRGLDASAFSLNVPGGRCEGCEGLGVRRVDLQFLPEVDVPCEVCGGRRFASDVLEVRWKGRNAAELLALTADEALPVLAGHPRLEEALRALRDVGLGYLELGQPSHTLSGGESRRLRLARELARASRRGAADTVFLLDEPTAGLHPEDVAGLLRRLVAEGATVVVATHHGALAAAADHVVVLGPGPGPDGGRVVREGPPEVAASADPW